MIENDNKMLIAFLSTYAEIKDKSECWIWKGPIDKTLGYGRSLFLGYPSTAHKVVYRLAYGKHLKKVNGRELCIRHLCNNRACVNPFHLALGNYTHNSVDIGLAGKRVIMTKEKLIEAIKLRKSGLSYAKIGKIIGTSGQVISTSLRGTTRYSMELLKEIKQGNNAL